jgi:hypothetical protein
MNRGGQNSYAEHSRLFMNPNVDDELSPRSLPPTSATSITKKKKPNLINIPGATRRRMGKEGADPIIGGIEVIARQFHQIYFLKNVIASVEIFLNNLRNFITRVTKTYTEQEYDNITCMNNNKLRISLGKAWEDFVKKMMQSWYVMFINGGNHLTFDSLRNLHGRHKSGNPFLVPVSLQNDFGGTILSMAYQ